MFEAHVLHLLRRYLGEYVHGLSAEALRISVWKGDVVLKDLKLKAEALNSLQLPVTVKAGFIGTVTLKVPWKSLGKEPVIVLIDRVFVLARPAPDARSIKEEDREKLFEAKLQQIEEAESATLEALSRSKLGSSPSGNSWLGSLIATIIGNLKITISNVHVRYEDSTSNPGNSFACGVTLAKLAAVTMDEQGNETFDTSGALDKLRKSVQLERLAMYHDSNQLPWSLDKKWEDLTPREWIEIFEDGISESGEGGGIVSRWAQDRNYLVSPINGDLKYHRLGNQERSSFDEPSEKVSLILSDVSFTITEAQYHDWIRLFEVFSRYKAYLEVAHIRPVVPVLENPKSWWRYAAQASLQQKRICYRFSWDQVQSLCHLRRRYIQLYASSLQKMSKVDNKEIRDIEKDLDPKVILLWRFLAHAKAESVRSKEEAERRMLKTKSWFSFTWRTPSEDDLVEETSDAQSIDERLTKEEWQAINNLLSYQPDEDLTFRSGKDMQNTTHYLINVSVGRAAAKIVNISQTEIVCGRFEQLHVSTKLKHRSTHCDLTLKYYGVSAPEGSLAQSGYDEQKMNALDACFVYSPLGENVDWRLSATISPCHATVFMESYDRFFEFLKRSKAISPTVALETATALQNKIGKVTRRAQEQIQMVLEEQSRFALDIDLHAPKVRIPIRTGSSSTYDSQFLLDFGHFTLHTKESNSVDEGQSLYSRFYISGRDIAANFTDCGFDCQCNMMASSSFDNQLSWSPDTVNFYSVIDRCGMSVIVDQIKVPHPDHPSTRISVQVPILGIHFSPVRYSRLLKLLNIINGTIQNGTQSVDGNFQAELAPWNPPDLSAEAQILVWKGIGYSVALWQPCFLVLSGYYLYVLESERSQSYFRSSSMAGKQIFEVPPTNVGGITSCIGVCARGIDSQKALESFSTLIIKFREEEKVTWLRGLIRATYRASAPPSVDVLGQHDDETLFPGTRPANLKTADLVVNGTLIETKLSIYGKTGDEAPEKLKETSILEVLAGGGKVHVVRCEGDLTVKVKLHSLKIKDELQASSNLSPQYLACSVQKDDSSPASLSSVEPLGNEPLSTEDDDIFKDALPDFLTSSDSVEAVTSEKDTVVGRTNSADVFYEAEDVEDSHFVSLTFLTRNTCSPDYDGVDSQMILTMSKLEFYFNRPTLVALIGFGLDLSAANGGPSVTNEEKNLNKESSENKMKIEEYGNTSVKGLLGYGKARVVFYLIMNVDSVSVYLNKEDGSQLAMFVQESFVLDLKVHPSSISIEGTLGNLRLCDLSLGSEHYWAWLCDIRNQGAESLIQFKFHSYSAEDDDYEGYDYSLQCRLSAVRIVFLYRFVQEITAYFMGLATPHTEEAVKYVDKVGGLEWLIEKNEIDGGSALKLDLSLDTPIIIVPRNSMSKDFIQLDLGNLKVGNEFSWHGHPESDPSAVHLDILDAEIIGINMAVGIDGFLGKPMIRDGQDIHIYVRRSLRDIFRKVPTLALEVKVGLLHCVMSDKEYTIILDCVTKNMNESPNLPPSFRDNKTSSRETIRLLADKVNSNSQSILSRTVTIMAVEVDYALLELCNGIDEESPLAHIILEGLWVSYRMTSLSEADLYVTIPRFSILDIRPDTKPEMRLMLGSCTDIPKQSYVGSLPVSIGFKRLDSKTPVSMNIPTSTMFVMDYRWRLSSQLFVIRVQQPRVLVVLDFLIAVCEFLVPGLGAITGREELMDPKNDPIGKKNGIVLLDPLYKQKEDVVLLSANSRLIADASAVDDYTYDGCGKTIRLVENKTKEPHSNGFRPIIMIGRGKSLRFVNVKIENGFLLRKYTYLSNDSSYSVSTEDGVEISFRENDLSGDIKRSTDNMKDLLFTSGTSENIENNSSTIQSFSFEAQVVSPEFTFYDSSKSSLDDSTHGEKLLRAKLDFSFIRRPALSIFKECPHGGVLRPHKSRLQFQEHTLGVTFQDVLYLTGLPIQGKPVIVPDVPDLDAYERVFGAQYADKTQLSFSELKNIAVNTENDHTRRMIAVLAVVFGAFIAPDPNKHQVSSVCVKYIENVDQVDTYAMGAALLAFTYRGISDPKKNIRGNLWVVLGSLLIRLRGLQNLLGVDLKNYPQEQREGVPLLPWILCQVQKTIRNHSAKYTIESLSPLVEEFYLVVILLQCLPLQNLRIPRRVGDGATANPVVYASKENDIWIRAVFKDLTMEAGSGLIILGPVDISGGYTSVKDKTNISVISTDIYVHLSLSVISLVLNLQSQAAGAFQYGNADLLSPCTHFDRVWVSQKENGHLNNLTFWRPRAPSNYVVLGDCVTSRPIPPSYTVMAVSSTYGRVRKPLRFELIGLFSAIQGYEGLEDSFTTSNDCSIWRPIPPQGYTALGCVAHIGNRPPPTHIVHCVRSDLVTSTRYSECIFFTSENRSFSSGFSIWLLDNVAGSFYAHPSTSCPPINICRDLNHLVLINSSRSHFSLENPPSNLDSGRDYQDGQPNCESANSSGWDAVRSISKASNCYVSTPNFERIWWDKGGDIRRPVSIWRPAPRPGYAILGDCIIEGLEPPALGIIFKADNPEISAKPVQFTQVAHIVRKGVDDAFFWYPIAPPGYASLGCVVSRTDEAPALESFCCPRMDLVSQANILEGPLSRSSSSKGSHCWSLWKVDNQAYTFLARSDLKRPSTRLAFTIGDSVKPKTRDNITAEMKLRCLSVTVLDSLCGTMTPLFDVTISNMKLATHGRLEALNAVLISSAAASTFNTQLESWEPLVEPFDGIFKFETYDAEAHLTSKFGKRARVAATTALNINLSTANLNMFLESVISWRRQRELEQKAIQLNEGHHGHANDSNFSALDEEDLQTVTIENKLGCDIYLKKAEQDSNAVELLHHDDYASLWIPPPRYSDRLNVAETREARRYVAVQIIKAKALPIVDDGNSHKFFCALRLVVDSQETYQQKLFPQSARTRCVRPVVSRSNGVEGSAFWNELFIFEVPRKGVAKLEVEVTNLAAKAGKGEVVGASSFSVGHGANPLKKVASVKMFNQASEVQNIAVYPLRRTVSSGSDDIHSHSSLVASTSYFERKKVANIQTEVEEGTDVDRDIGFWVGLSPKGSWESFRSFLPLSVITKTLNGDYIAVDVIIKNGKKHAVLRGLVTVLNDSDVKLEVSICHGSMIHTHSPSAENVVDSLNPGSSCILPWKSALKGTDFCLLVRPCTDDAHPPYSWGHLVNIGHSWGKEQQSIEHGSFSRQNTVKHGIKMPTLFNLSQLEKTDVFFCSSTPNSDQFWLSVSTDASALHTELNAPVYDWKISINSPLKLENRLPCPARFIVWEKSKNGNNIERQRGFISSRGTVNIHSADIQNPIYVTLFIQGGWCLEKDPVLVLDLSSNDHVSSFWMVRQQRRRLRVSIERDIGGTIAAPKTVRFFVPYWISNDSSLPLAYQVVEIEPLEASDVSSLQRSKTGRFGTAAMRSPSISTDRNSFGLTKNLQVLEVIEDTSPTPSMLSPQDYVGRGGVMLFSSRNDNYLSPRVGIAVSVRESENYSPGISLLDLEKKQRVDVKAFNSDGSYYNLSAVLHMSPDRTKVIHFQQQTLFINRVGCSLCLQQCDTQSLQWIHPTDPPLQLRWQSLAKAEMLRLRMDGYGWSTPFSVGTEGVMCISLNKTPAIFPAQLRVEVRSGTTSSRYEVIFRPISFSSPYRIENHSLFLPIRFQQVDGSSDSWKSLLPNSSASFSWEDLGRPRQLELLVDGDDRSRSLKYSIDEISDHQPVFVNEEPTRVLRINILREDKVNVIKISDWMPENEPEAALSRRTSFSSIPISENDIPQQSTLNSEFHVIFEIAELGLSIIDHTPEEILYLSLQSLLLSYSTGLGSGITRLKLRMRGFQVDNQLPLTPTPVLFRPQRVEDETDYILKFSITQQSNGSLDLCVYPYIGFQGPENSAFLINIHEPIIWRIHGMIQQINLSRLSETESTVVSVDPIFEIGVFNFSEVRFKVSMAMSPSQRPVGVLGFWASLMTALGNTENMPIRINQRFQENIRTRKSVLMSNAIANIKKDILGQPLQLLSGVDILGNASSALGHMSKGVAALSMDKKFIQSRQRQESKGVEDFGDVIREGGGALAKGFFRGFTGILTKPLEGAKASGVEGFVQGVGKGIIGAAAQPVSGVLDLLSKTTEGANAMRIKIASAIASEDQLLRKRLPRVIGGDNLLRPYDLYKAQGQVILQLAESISFFRQVDLFKVRGKFALSDAYEDHFLLPKAKYLLVTHRRILLLQQASSIIGHKKFNPARDPCSVLWDVLWDDLMTMELTHGKKDRPDSIPSRIILYLQAQSSDTKDQVRIIKCNRDSNQAFEVYTSIEQAMNTYGPNQAKDVLRRKAAKPYSAIVDSAKAEAIPRETFYLMSPQQMPSPVCHSSTFGTGAN